MTSPVLGWRVVEFLGCKYREMLIAAWDEYGDEIDVNKCLKEDGNEEGSEVKIAALFGESFYSIRLMEDDGIGKKTYK